MYLVWVRGNRGPEPKIWHDEDAARRMDGKYHEHLQMYRLPPDHAHLGLDVLQLMYPYQGEGNGKP